MVFLDEQNTGQLSVCAGSRLQCYGSHSGNFAQHLSQFIHELQCTLGCFSGLQGMERAEPRKVTGVIIYLGIVLHGTASQRVHILVDVIVQV